MKEKQKCKDRLCYMFAIYERKEQFPYNEKFVKKMLDNFKGGGVI